MTWEGGEGERRRRRRRGGEGDRACKLPHVGTCANFIIASVVPNLVCLGVD